MFRNRLSSWVVMAVVFVAAAAGFQAYFGAQQDDSAVAKIIQIGKTDNQVMTWNDYASNRFGGRETGTNAYNDATQWAVWQFKQWGIDAELDEAGEVPVGFNRGPWFGKMLKPSEKALRFGTPSFTAGTKGVQKGGVVILKADPFSIPGRNTTPENVEKKKAAVQAAIAEVNGEQGGVQGQVGAHRRRQHRLRPRRPPRHARIRGRAADPGAHQGARGRRRARHHPVRQADHHHAVGDDGRPELAADQHPRRLRLVVGQAAGPARRQAAEHPVRRDQGARGEERAGGTRVRHPQLVQDGADQVPQRRGHHQGLDLPGRVHRHGRPLRLLQRRHGRHRRRVRVSRRAWRRCA